ncbi:MAG: hypothetical protein KJ858_00895 [Nanoarchaeota archaeon]|nr:hypothetical protein [Nanoarchaeota archaeon]
MAIKADLHMHGPIGFEPYWLRVQGYEGKNLLQLIADRCFKAKLGICAITSESDQTDDDNAILRNSPNDRLGFLVENYLDSLPREYEVDDKFGTNSLVVAKGNKAVHLINGQTVIVRELGKRYDHLVIGSNSVPNSMNIADTVQYCNDHGLLHGLEHPALQSHFGLGFYKAMQVVDQCDFVEGHNAQLRWLRAFSKLPKVGKKIAPYTRTSNDLAKEFARKNKKHYLANSDAHRIESAGIASNEFNEGELDFSSESRLFKTLRSSIIEGNFTTNEGYESICGWINWVWKFQRGIRGEQYKQE